MASTKRRPTSIWPGPALEAYLAQVGPRSPREGVSRMIERALVRYRHVLAGCLPAWSPAEWAAVVQILQDHDMASIGGLQVLGMVLAAAAEQPRTVPGSGHTLSANFIFKVKRMDAGAQVAVAEVVEGYWRRHDRFDPSRLAAWLTACGVADPAATQPA